MDISLNAALVHARRVAAGPTVAALADRVGVHSSVIWAIEEGNERQLEQLPLVTIVALAQSLELHPGDVFSDRDQSASPPAPDNVALEAALLQHGEAITRDDLAVALDWPLARVERALAALTSDSHRPAPGSTLLV
jgi:transcriptional regulator with XRE-family HTH domain